MIVSTYQDPSLQYPQEAPFDPDESFPERARLPGRQRRGDNKVYGAVRQALFLLGLDREHFGTKDWNPLKGMVSPGSRVVLKPNWVMHEDVLRRGKNCLVTHGSVIRTMLDYVYLAGGETCAVTLCDAPLQSANFGDILAQQGIQEIERYSRTTLGLPLNVLDLRLKSVTVDSKGFIDSAASLPGDPRGSVGVRLDDKSELEAVSGAGIPFAVTDYSEKGPVTHHRNGSHEYLISRTVLDADCFINLPKMKSHQKTGMSVCLKNIVGVNADKSWLPHFRRGGTDSGGDEYPSHTLIPALHSRARRLFQGKNRILWGTARSLWRRYRAVREMVAFTPRSHFISDGAWPGNDTLWRTIVDLNKILFFSDGDGRIHSEPRRRYLAVVDGIIGGEGNGPLRPDPKPCGVIAAGCDPLAVDIICAGIMGFPWSRIPLLRGAAGMGAPRFSRFSGDLEEIDLQTNNKSRIRTSAFVPPPSWDILLDP